MFIGTLDLAAVHSVRQEIYYIEDEEDKRRKLVEFLDSMEPDEKVHTVRRDSVKFGLEMSLNFCLDYILTVPGVPSQILY